MIRVVIESPYAGDVTGNIWYARQALRHSLHRGEAPIASHLLFTQDGVLNDDDPNERILGMKAGWAWMPAADIVAFYADRGISRGMREGLIQAIKALKEYGTVIEVRTTKSNKNVRLLGLHIPTVQEEFDAAVETLWQITGISASRPDASGR